MTGDPSDATHVTLTRRSALGLALGTVALARCAFPQQGGGRSPASPKTSAGATTHHPHSGPPTPSSPTPTTQPPTPTVPPLELPLGGRELFPRYRLAGWCGAPSARTLGELGLGNLDDKAGEMVRDVGSYADGRTVLPVMELIAVVVQGSPGDSGLWRSRQPDSVVDRWLQMARDHKALLLLNIQPRRATFLDEVKAFGKYLREPDVGVALDPEWAMSPGQVPGRAYGHGWQDDRWCRPLPRVDRQGEAPTGEGTHLPPGGAHGRPDPGRDQTTGSGRSAGRNASAPWTLSLGRMLYGAGLSATRRRADHPQRRRDRLSRRKDVYLEVDRTAAQPRRPSRLQAVLRRGPQARSADVAVASPGTDAQARLRHVRVALGYQ